MKSIVSASFAALSLVLVACAAPSGEDAETGNAELSTSVVPGTFRLFSSAHHVSDPKCDSYTDLTLTASKASLVDGLAGKCALTAKMNPNPRSYSLQASVDGCGVKHYTGSRRVSGGPSTDGSASIKITDFRASTCEFAIQALVIVDETEPGFPGPITRRLFSDDSHPAPAERVTIACDEPVDHGASVKFYESVPSGSIVRAEYTETTIATTTLVASMADCAVISRPPPTTADGVTVTRCGQAEKDSGFAVELSEGGFTGIPEVSILKITKAGSDVVKTLTCRQTP